jgi:hypothetical protein
MQDRTQQRVVNLDVSVASVAADESKLAEFVHEMTDAGSGGADHLRQCFLTNVPTDRLRAKAALKPRKKIAKKKKAKR